MTLYFKEGDNMSYPKTLKVSLSSNDCYMELDTRKSDCNSEITPHWHLCQHNSRISQISVYGDLAKIPDVSSSFREEAENLTALYSVLICEYYTYNAEYRADY